MKSITGCLCILTTTALLASQALAGPFSQMFVFGDSLSDMGNVSASTFGIQPGAAYFSGRFSNGPVYAEHLSIGLGLGTLSRSGAGGTNYAFGGAKTTGTGGLEGFFIDDIDEQVSDYLSGGPADPDALYVVFGGANDLFDGQTNVNVPVDSLIDDIQDLINAQASNFLVMNLPLLGLTPRFNGDSGVAASWNSLTSSYNSTLDLALNSLETTNPNLNLFRLDVAGMISDVVANPSEYGMTNATDSAAPGLSPGDGSYDTNLIVPNPHEYLFWDDIHPATAAHAALAQEALELLTYDADYDADYDFDGDVDSTDLTHNTLGWETRFGSDLTGQDFLTWQQQFGTNVTPFQAIQAVPEPSSATLLTITLLCGLLARKSSVRPQAVT